MAPRTVYANLQDGLQPFSLWDQSLADMGNLGVIPCELMRFSNAYLWRILSECHDPAIASAIFIRCGGKLHISRYYPDRFYHKEPCIPLPNMSVTQNVGLPPKVSGDLYVPVEGGELSVQGQHRPARNFAPADWSARLGFRTQF
jgi:hypothetical protein